MIDNKYFEKGEIVWPINGTLFYKIQQIITDHDQFTGLFKKTTRPFVVINDPEFQKVTGLVMLMPQKTLSTFNVNNKLIYIDNEGILREVCTNEILTADWSDLRTCGKKVPQEIMEKITERITANITGVGFDNKIPCTIPPVMSELPIVKESSKTDEETAKEWHKPDYPRTSDGKPIISNEIRKEIEDLIIKGTSAKEIIELYGISHTTINRYKRALAKNGKISYKRQHRPRLKNKEKESLIKDIQKGISEENCRKKYSISHVTYSKYKTQSYTSTTKTNNNTSSFFKKSSDIKIPSMLNIPKNIREEAKKAYIFIWDTMYLSSADFKEKYDKSDIDLNSYLNTAETLLNTYNIKVEGVTA